MQPGRQANAKVCQKRAPRPPLAPPKTLQEFLGGQGELFSSWGFGTLELPERAPRLGKTRISAVSAMSGMAWPNRGLKDMTSMSGLRQGFPQENTFGLSNTPSAASARRIQCAAHRPPRVGVVMQRVVTHDSSFGRVIRIRFCRNRVKSSGSREETGRECFAGPAKTENFRNLSKFGANRQKNSQKKQAGRQTNIKVSQKCAPRPPVAPPKTLQEFLGG